VARRLRAEGIALVVAVRDDTPPHGLPERRLAPLDVSAASALLAPHDLAPATRAAVQAAAAGNPLALVELPTALSPEQRTGRAPLEAPLPVPARLEAVYVARLAGLAAADRDLLLLAAAEGTGDPRLRIALEDPQLVLWAGAAAFYIGDEDAAVALHERAVLLARAAGDASVLPFALTFLATAHLWSGRPAVAEAEGEEGRRLAREAGQDNFALRVETVLAGVAALRGDEPRAERWPTACGRPRASAGWCTFFFGAYKYPRELTWIIGVVLLVLTFVMSLTGYLSPFDQRAFWATVVASNITGTGPLVGPFLADFPRGGAELGATTLSRFYAIHMLLLPGAIVALIGAHLYLVARLGTTAPPWIRADTSSDRRV